MNTNTFTFEQYLYIFYDKQYQDKYTNRETQVLMSLEDIEYRYKWLMKNKN